MGRPVLIGPVDSFVGVDTLGLDTSPIIYFIERHPRYVDLVREVFRLIDGGAVLAVTSVITLTEVLTLPH